MEKLFHNSRINVSVTDRWFNRPHFGIRRCSHETVNVYESTLPTVQSGGGWHNPHPDHFRLVFGSHSFFVMRGVVPGVEAGKYDWVRHESWNYKKDGITNIFDVIERAAQLLPWLRDIPEPPEVKPLISYISYLRVDEEVFVGKWMTVDQARWSILNTVQECDIHIAGDDSDLLTKWENLKQVARDERRFMNFEFQVLQVKGSFGLATALHTGGCR